MKNRITYILKVLAFTSILSSCSDFLDADLDKSIITENQIFSNDITATSAMVSIYYDMANFGSSFSGSYVGFQALAGLSGSELKNYTQTPTIVEYESHNILPVNLYSKGLWDMCYNVIYRTNDLLIGLEDATGVRPATKSQLQGEALFLRAFCYFHLVNLYGDVPLTLNTDYNENAKLSRTSTTVIYNQVVADLIAAQGLLTETYPTIDRTRPNKGTATALLARVYLYLEDWANAEIQATAVLSQSSYALTELNNVFLVNSNEAIWQLNSVVPQINTVEGYYFIITSTPRYHILNPVLVNSFEANDNRRTSWVGSFTQGAQTFYFPYKYKVTFKATTTPYSEFSTLFRLGEQYLIRAEAQARQEKLDEAIADLDAIRSRAGLLKIADINPGITKDELLLAIEHERYVELFTEWGHRWFDLKRTDRAVTVLGGDISQNDLLWPLPKNEFDRNSNLGNQNPGY